MRGGKSRGGAWLAWACLAASGASVPGAAFAQAFPSKPTRLITQFGPGAPGDLIARLVAQQLSEVTGQPVVVDNRVGAGGVLALTAVARAAPDGYTLSVSNSTVPVVSVVLAKTPPPFDPVKDLTPVTIVGDIATLIVASSTLPQNSLREVIDFAKSNPGKISYGTTGVGGPQHMAGEQIRLLTGADLTHIPYKTSPVLDAASGALQLAFVVSAQALPLIKAGKVKLVAVLADSRFRLMPEVPTVTEVVPGFEPPPRWTAMFAPGGLPPAILHRLHADIVKGMGSPQGRTRTIDLGFEPLTSKSPEEFAAQVHREIELVARIAKAANIPKTD